MKLYYSAGVCSLAVRIILHELRITCDYESVNLKTKKTEAGQDYLVINPKGSVPALQLNNNELLTENTVILQYLADNHDAVDLLPPVGNIKRYRVLEWLNFISTDLHRYCAPLFWAKIPEDLKQNLFTPILNKKLAVIEQHLHQYTYLVGDNFTLPDSYLCVILVWLKKLNIKLTEWPNLSRYFEELKKRKSIQEAFKEENING